MTQKDKELLLKDLSARLPYGVKICYIYNGEECVSTIEKIDAFSYIWDNYNGCYHVREIKPYLFPISSMTDEQKNLFSLIICKLDDSDMWRNGDMIFIDNETDLDYLLDFYNKNHIDFRGLIPMGLALDATGLNIY